MSENETEIGTPISDTLLVMTATSLENSDFSARELMIARIAALVALDASAASYALNAIPAADSGITVDDVEDVLVAVAPVVGTARIVSATANIAEGLGIVIALAEAELEEEELEAEAENYGDPLYRRCYRPNDPASNTAEADRVAADDTSPTSASSRTSGSAGTLAAVPASAASANVRTVLQRSSEPRVLGHSTPFLCYLGCLGSLGGTPWARQRRS